MTAIAKMTLHDLLMAAQSAKSLKRWATLKAATDARIAVEARTPQVGDGVQVIPFRRGCYRGVLVSRDDEWVTVEQGGGWPLDMIKADAVILKHWMR